MRVIKRKVLSDFGARFPDAKNPLDYWFQLTKRSRWHNTSEVKALFGLAVDFVGNNRAVFDIKGNSYRLICEINYAKQAVYVRFLGTHKEYDKVDASTVKMF